MAGFDAGVVVAQVVPHWSSLSHMQVVVHPLLLGTFSPPNMYCYETDEVDFYASSSDNNANVGNDSVVGFF